MRWLAWVWVGCLGCSAGTEGLPDGAAAGADVTPRLDASAAESGVMDLGVDAGLAHGTPHIVVEPPETLRFDLPIPRPPPPIAPRTLPLVVRNIGDGDLEIQGLRWTGPGGDPNAPSIDDFHLSVCGAMPCRPGLFLCGAAAAGCRSSSVTIDVTYADNDGSAADLAELSIASNDPSRPSVGVSLEVDAP